MALQGVGECTSAEGIPTAPGRNKGKFRAGSEGHEGRFEPETRKHRYHAGRVPGSKARGMKKSEGGGGGPIGGSPVAGRKSFHQAGQQGSRAAGTEFIPSAARRPQAAVHR